MSNASTVPGHDVFLERATPISEFHGPGFVVRMCYTCNKVFLNDDDHEEFVAKALESEGANT